MLLKSLPHVKYWWESYWERHNEDESMTFRRGPTWVAFVDALKEEFYHVGNYDDQYTRWMTLHQERDQNGVRVHQHLPYLVLKLGIRDSE
jgi:hypothetical protein